MLGAGRLVVTTRKTRGGRKSTLRAGNWPERSMTVREGRARLEGTGFLKPAAARQRLASLRRGGFSAAPEPALGRLARPERRGAVIGEVASAGNARVHTELAAATTREETSAWPLAEARTAVSADWAYAPPMPCWAWCTATCAKKTWRRRLRAFPQAEPQRPRTPITTTLVSLRNKREEEAIRYFPDGKSRHPLYGYAAKILLSCGGVRDAQGQRNAMRYDYLERALKLIQTIIRR